MSKMSFAYFNLSDENFVNRHLILITLKIFNYFRNQNVF